MSNSTKPHKSYAQQLAQLEGRGMCIDNRNLALETLRQISYYRLSGYWYPFRKFASGTPTPARQDDFYPGTRFVDVLALYRFDEALRTATFSALTRVEVALRSLLGHELGTIDPYIHLDPSRLSARARNSGDYQRWLGRYNSELAKSREDFVKHHKQKYGGKLPIWAATEILDWGALTYLFSFSPRSVQDAIAVRTGLTAPQLHSWLRSLNPIRNTCAHHGRLFNRVHTKPPKLPSPLNPDCSDLFQPGISRWERTFAHLTLLQFLSERLGLGANRVLSAAVRAYPQVPAIPITHLGVPASGIRTGNLWP
ncbi:Abi family protein [Dermabacteraceae bacterium P13115]